MTLEQTQDNVLDEFVIWWWALDQNKLRCNVSERDAFKIWLGSRKSISIPSCELEKYFWVSHTFRRTEYERDVKKAVGANQNNL